MTMIMMMATHGLTQLQLDMKFSFIAVEPKYIASYRTGVRTACKIGH